jgi:hypothetical protein
MNQITNPISFSNRSPRATSSLAGQAPARVGGGAWRRTLLLAAAGWNIIGGVTALLDPARHFAQMYTTTLALDQPLALFFYRCAWINVIAWGAAYVIAAFVPTSRTAVLVAGGAGKLVYFLASVGLFASGVGNGLVLTAGFMDVVFAGLFALVVFTERNAIRKM